MSSPELPPQDPKDLIMSAEAYAQVEHDVPYNYSIENGDKQLTYFGVSHTYDPGDPLFADIQAQFDQMTPDLVLVEGINPERLREPAFIERVKKLSSADTILKAGESGFLTHLAATHGVEVDSPEPPLKDELQNLIDKGFSKDEIFAHYYYRQVDQQHHMSERPDLSTEVAVQMSDFVERTQWERFDYSLRHLEEIGKKYWPNNYSVDDPTHAAERHDPIPWKDASYPYTRINLIGAESSKFRDEHIVKKIQEHLKTKSRIFIVYGASHAVMEEPAIRKIMEDQPA